MTLLTSPEETTVQAGEQDHQAVSRIRESRLETIQALQAQGINPYPYIFDKTDENQALQDRYQDLASGEETEDTVRVAGRIMALRNSGMFIDLQDPSGKLQLFCHKEHLPEAGLALLKLLDIGDMVGGEGT